MEHELIPTGLYQGRPAVVLDGRAPRATGPDWMVEAARGWHGPLLLQYVAFPDHDVALERLASSREELPLLWRLVDAPGDWPASGAWTVLDLSPLLAQGVGLDPATTRAALAELPPVGVASELVVRLTSVSAAALDEAFAWFDPVAAWLVVPEADVATATRATSRCLTPWGVRVG